jgi:hypothetical protein
MRIVECIAAWRSAASGVCKSASVAGGLALMGWFFVN